MKTYKNRITGKVKAFNPSVINNLDIVYHEGKELENGGWVEHAGISPAAKKAISEATGSKPLDSLSKDELKEKAESYGLTVRGTKDELIERIKVAESLQG